MSIAMKLYGQSSDLSKSHQINQFELIQKLAEPFSPHIIINNKGEHIYTFEDKSQFFLTKEQTIQVKLF